MVMDTTVIIYIYYTNVIVERDWLNTILRKYKEKKRKNEKERGNCKIVNSKKTVTSGTRHVCISSLWLVIMQKALELRKKSFLPLEVCEAKVGLEEEEKKEKEEKKNHRWHCFASIWLHRGIFPGSLGTWGLTFQFSAFGREGGRGEAWSFLRRVHVVLWDTSVKQSRLLSRFKPRVEIRAS